MIMIIVLSVGLSLIGLSITVCHVLAENAKGTKGRRDDVLIPMINRFIVGTLSIALILYILHQAGADIKSALAGLGIGGLVLSFAFQPTVKNFLAGCLILIKAPYNPGHYVKVAGGKEGIVTDMDFTSTTLENGWGHRISIPNAEINSAPIINCSATVFRPINVEIIVDPSQDSKIIQHWASHMPNDLMNHFDEKVGNDRNTAKKTYLDSCGGYIAKYDHNGFHVRFYGFYGTYSDLSFRNVRQRFMQFIADSVQDRNIALGSGPLDVKLDTDFRLRFGNK